MAHLVGPTHTVEFEGRPITATWFNAPFFPPLPRVFVAREDFLDAFAWSDDPAARIILERAIEADFA